MGGHIVNYDSMLVLTHFKGHAMGGFGGSMKNIAIGCADGRIGKQQVHAVSDVNLPWDQWPGKEMLMETMAESAKAVCDYFGKKIVFINVLRRMSVDCDCAGTSAAEPTIPDIGILASTDILAIDQASVDLVYGRPAAEKHDLVERIESRRGLHQLTAMKALGMGNDQYDLITVPKFLQSRNKSASGDAGSSEAVAFGEQSVFSMRRSPLDCFHLENRHSNQT